MALRGSAQSTDIGGASDICYATYLFIGASRQAEIDLRLLRETLPKASPRRNGEGTSRNPTLFCLVIFRSFPLDFLDF